MKKGKHVFSEVLPVQTMKEAVELIEAVEETGMIYGYAENYCYMPSTFEMKKLYNEGKIGEFEYGECEYVHNGEKIWPSITYGEKDHWRNRMYATFYCTHSLGPIIHATGLRPTKVVGFEGCLNHSQRRHRLGSRGASFGMEMVTLENGGGGTVYATSGTVATAVGTGVFPAAETLTGFALVRAEAGATFALFNRSGAEITLEEISGSAALPSFAGTVTVVKIA
jgi:predicted dehydrogenase